MVRYHKYMLWGLGLLLCLAGPVFGELRLGVQADLDKFSESRSPVQVDGGFGLSLRLSRPGMFEDKLEVREGNRQVTVLEGGRFTELLSLEWGPARYWIIGEYSGGAHCCGQYHFLAQSGPQSPVKYLGNSLGHNGGPLSLKQALRPHQGQLYFQDLDNRFDYFHESHAGSLLVNLPEKFLRLTPTGIKVDNLPFKAHFLAMAEKTEGEIRRAAARRTSRPQAILQGGIGRGFENLNFSDQLGQLLVKRTIYLLYAREEQRAWESFARDVARYYGTTRYVPELQAEIRQTLQHSPY
jgi:hypothetical protein